MGQCHSFIFWSKPLHNKTTNTNKTEKLTSNKIVPVAASYKAKAKTGTMPVFTEASTQLTKLQNVSRINGTRYNSLNNAWKYTVFAFTKHVNHVHYYRLVLNHMLRTVKTDTALTFALVFQIAPAVVQHRDGNSYIIMRMRVNSKATITVDEVVNQVMERFNLIYGADLKMGRCSDRESVDFFKNLFATEYVQTDTRNTTPASTPADSPPQQPSPQKHSFALTESCEPPLQQTPLQPRYALATSHPEPPLPPMPKTLDLSLLNAYYQLFQNDGLYYTPNEIQKGLMLGNTM